MKLLGLCDPTDLITNATEQLKKLSQNSFQHISNIFTVAGKNI